MAPGPAGAGEIVIDATPGTAAGEAIDRNSARAQSYVEPARPAGKDVVVVIEPGGAAAVDPLRARNAQAMDRNRRKAQARSRGKGDSSQGSTLVILPGSPAAAGHDANAEALRSNSDKAAAWADGTRRRGCSSSTVSVGTVGEVVVTDRNGNAAADQVTATVVGGCP